MVVRSNFISMKSFGLAMTRVNQGSLTPDNEVDIVPVGEQQALEHLHDLLQSALADCTDRLIKALRLEFPEEHLRLLNPLGAESLVLR